MTIKEILCLILELHRLELTKAPKAVREYIFKQIPEEFKVTVCLGCGKRYESSDCGCPAGSAEQLRDDEEISKLLQEWKE